MLDEKELNAPTHAESEDAPSEDDVETGTNGSDVSEDDVVEISAKELTQLRSDRENYKRGMLSAKAKPRSLDETPTAKTKEEPKGDATDEKIRSVMHRENERRVLHDVVDSDSPNYMKELVDDSTFREVIQYLPKTLDKSSESAIRRALKVAVHAWQFDNGMTKEKREKPEATLTTTSRRTLGSSQDKPAASKSGERKILKSTAKIDSWYKK